MFIVTTDAKSKVARILSFSLRQKPRAAPGTDTVDANKNATTFAHLSQTQHASSEAELACMHS